MSRQPSSEKCSPCLRFLAASAQQALVDDVADMLEIGGEEHHLEHLGALGRRELVLHQPGEVKLDRLLVGVDLVLERRHLLGAAAVALVEGQDRLAQHQLDLVGELQHRARRRVQRQGGTVEERRVEMVEPLRLAPRHRVGQQPLQQGRRPPGQRQEDHDDPEVEERVEMRRQPCRVAAEPRHGGGRRREREEDQGDADRPEAEIADQHPPRRGRLAQREPQGHQRAAEVGAEHQRQRQRQADEAGAGQRDDEEYEGDAGMHEPGEGGRKDHASTGSCAEPRQHLRRHVAAAHRRRCRADQPERKQDQSEADQDAPGLRRARPLAPACQHHAGEQEERRHRAEVDRERLHHKRGPEVGAEHQRQRRRQRHEPAGRRRR